MLVGHSVGYHLHDLQLIAGLAILISLIPLIGYVIVRMKATSLARVLAWLLTIVAVMTVERLSTSEPSGTRMLLIIVALLWSMKAVVGVESGARNSITLPFFNWLAFTALWFGMRPKIFATLSNQPRSDWKSYVIRGLIRIGLGIVLIAIAVLLAGGSGGANSTTLSPWRLWSATGCILSGFSLLVHFGIFNLLVGFWRRFSVNCTPLFRAPLLSKSLTEFWGRRWNLAFSEMTALSVFRPLKSWLGKSEFGPMVATVSAFLFSGLLHELAISVPVQAGFGLPLLYFVLHGVGMFIENKLDRSGIEFLKRPWVGRIWTWLWVLLPLPILFHRPFLEGCVWPLIGIGH